MSLPDPQTIYLDAASEPSFAIAHMPASDAACDTSVLIVPPFGWDDVSSYRCLREWAIRLALAGYPSLRISLPSTGDSGGTPRDPERLDAWTETVQAAADWLRETSGAPRLGLIGVGLGGLVSYRAAALGAPVDDLVLWGTPARGRAFVRELGTFARLETSQFAVPGADPPEPLPAGDLSVSGFLLTAETIERLESLDLSALTLPRGTECRVLLLERDGISVDRRLREHLESSDATLAVAPGPGYAEMTSHPQQARPPLEVIDRVGAWLDERTTTVGGTPPLEPIESVEIEVSGVAVRETTLTVKQPFGALSAVVTQPAQPSRAELCAVLLNAGAIRRIGPSRMWVEAARRWAARGVPTVRLDIEGVGDADGDDGDYVEDAGLYVPKLVDQVLATLDVLQDRGIGERFALGGLCSGAYWSFHAALEDPRVVAAFALNPRVLVWDPEFLLARDFRRGVLRPSNWHKVRHVSPRRALAIARAGLGAPRRLASARARRRSLGGEEVGVVFDRYAASGKRLMLLFSDNEPLHEELISGGQLARLDRSPNVTLERIPVRDHTLRPSWAQTLAHAALDRALERELELAPQRQI